MTSVSMIVEPTTLQANKAVVSQFIAEVWNRRDPDAASAFLTREYLDYAYQPAGVDGLRQAIITTRDAFPDYIFVIEDIVAEAATVVVRMRLHGTQLGAFRGTPPSGNPIDVAVYRTFRLVDGKIAEHRGLLDTATLLRQIGTTPA
jgi:steroid delta-isomerase-like uncharacterized protein